MTALSAIEASTEAVGRYPALFTPFSLAGLNLPNRLAVAPMTRTSALEDGCATRAMARYYASFARGGFALVISEGTYPDEEHSQGYFNQPGLANSAHVRAWREVTAAVHAAGARMVVQLMHAGALAQGNRYRVTTLAPSAVRPRGEKLPSYGGSGPFALPYSAALVEIRTAIESFAAAAARARDAGFDGVELHGGNGYLIDQFLTDYTNRRADHYGGDLENRLRFTVEAIAAVRCAVGPGYPVGIRLSQSKINDRDYKWPGGEADAAAIFARVARAGVDYIHVSERDATRPAFEQGPSLASLARTHGAVPVIVNGRLDDPARAARTIESGMADVVSLARGALANMDWPRRVAAGIPLAPLAAEAFATLRTL